jgi:hypothetical protein
VLGKYFNFLADVISHENIDHNFIGVYATRLLAGGQRAFLPVHVHSSRTSTETDVIAILRPGSDVEDVRWRRYVREGFPVAWQPVGGAAGLVPEGARLRIALGGAITTATIFEVSFLSNGVARAYRFVLLAR